MSQVGATWARIFTEHGATLRGFFIRRGAREDAEDLVQETYLRMLRARETRGEAIANPEAYMYTVALNLAREFEVVFEKTSANPQVPKPYYVDGRMKCELPG